MIITDPIIEIVVEKTLLFLFIDNTPRGYYNVIGEEYEKKE